MKVYDFSTCQQGRELADEEFVVSVYTAAHRDKLPPPFFGDGFIVYIDRLPPATWQFDPIPGQHVSISPLYVFNPFTHQVSAILIDQIAFYGSQVVVAKQDWIRLALAADLIRETEDVDDIVLASYDLSWTRS